MSKTKQLNNDIILVNDNKQPLTPDKLKTFKGLIDVSDCEAQEIVYALNLLAVVLFELNSGNNINI
ncbi:MAG TPA: hypothetical protein VD908_18115 [Cytophagales bacterium]|nr:hypothetical protein [Cytophagales bacterium]